MQLEFWTGPMHLDEGGDELRRNFGVGLSEALEGPVLVSAERSYAALLDRVRAKGAAIAWLPPALFVRAKADGVIAKVLRIERSGGDAYQGAIFVRSDSAIQRPADLRGARIAWVDAESSAGYLFPRLALREAGLDPTNLFSSETFVESHSRSVRAVVSGFADAGATFVQLLDPQDPKRGIAIAGWTGFADTRSLRAVLVSASIPSDTVCVLAGVADADRIEASLASFHTRPHGQRLLRMLLNGDRLVPTDGTEYEPVSRALTL